MQTDQNASPVDGQLVPGVTRPTCLHSPAQADAPADLRRPGIPAIGNNDPLFYRQPVDEHDDDGNFIARTVQPVTAKHFESLFTRIRRHCQWADNIA